MNPLKFSLVTYSLIFIVSFLDVLLDWQGMGHMNTHTYVEILLGLLALGGFTLMLYWNIQQSRKIKTMHETLSNTEKQLSESQQQAQKLMGEFSKIIQNQFDEWSLTKSEKEVGLLLLKGLTLDEISTVRETREKTVRQQASNLYKKAGLSGRHELVAYFFEELLVY
ncbi:LuxR C-terminal-related transcriptional regulator [Thiomicrorhabdus sp. ZW0627]|uniref:helix-turn-helix transcriptional regulator n=1 Tax=Thiomicrorhabdus sp. ZW0627 TaxID=3039774 RepID=UPI0024368051|nr:LuxR C-terminal-related transcriptional regulator [Thiomicrorhabdus sp. ZW0627]MDG6773881.1 LuxR C-terminal-related transcriptional regulator [Thiomicrorhabdus sp. ZW0627]